MSEEDLTVQLDLLKTGLGEWNVIVANWKNTHSLRAKELENIEFSTHDYFEKYPVLLQVKSYELVSIRKIFLTIVFCI